MGERSSIERVTADDLMSLATERGSTPMQVGAVLFLDTTGGLDSAGALAVLAARIRRVPRLRQRLVDTPVGCGRPLWVDDPAFDVSHHLSSQPCPAPGGEPAVFAVAAALLSARLPRSRPLWAATLVTGVDPDGTGDRAALIIVFHHVLADGMGGLSILGSLLDGSGDRPAGADDFPRAMPGAGALVRDAWARRFRGVRRLPASVRRVGGGLLALRSSIGAPRLARTSLNVPTGTRVRFLDVRVDLAAVKAAGRVRNATVNDVVLTAIGGALHRLLEARGPAPHLAGGAARGAVPDGFVVSVPFSGRGQAGAGELGNQSGVIPISVPGVGHPFDRLAAVAATTRAAKLAPAGASTALLGPFFRLLAPLGLFRWFIDRQRTITTFATNLRGPASPVTIFGCPITAIAPLTVATGNVTVSFAVLSYAGTLAVTLVADPDTCPDQAVLRDLLAAEFAGLTDAARPSGGDDCQGTDSQASRVPRRWAV